MPVEPSKEMSISPIDEKSSSSPRLDAPVELLSIVSTPLKVVRNAPHLDFVNDQENAKIDEQLKVIFEKKSRK